MGDLVYGPGADNYGRDKEMGVSRRCVTHHHACHCREEQFANAQALAELYRKALKEVVHPGNNFKDPIDKHYWDLVTEALRKGAELKGGE